MEPQPATPDSEIARIAAAQHRVVARRQLLAAGIGAGAIRWRMRVSRLFPQHRGVYSVGVPDPGRLGRRLAAVLAVDGAVLSHRSAAVHWGLLRERAGPIEVTRPARSGTASRTGIRVHATRSLLSFEMTRRLHIPITTVERTLIDLAGGDLSELERAVEQAFVLKLLGRTRMTEALGAAGGRAGTRELRRLLAGLLPQLPFTRSELERRFLKLTVQGGVPLPVVNRHREEHRVDFHWPAQRLVVETDGRGSHDNPLAFERDRARDLELELAGWRVVRLSWRQVVEQPAPVLELLRRTLRPGRSAP